MTPLVKIVIASHKKYRFPEDEIYLPLFVGADINDTDLDITKDNTGDNISKKNLNYCELTGLYWANKNLEADYKGLVHYRRHFSMNKDSNDPFGNILTSKQLYPLLDKYDVFVPKKRKYYIESLYSHYIHTHDERPLEITKSIIYEKYPEYIQAYDQTLNQKYGHMFNMMIMKQDLFKNYCDWLFSILFELENNIDTSEMDKFSARFYGRISEILFNVWLNYQIDNNLIDSNKIKELNWIYMEKINWFKKATSFILAKIFHIKYKQSF